MDNDSVFEFTQAIYQAKLKCVDGQWSVHQWNGGGASHSTIEQFGKDQAKAYDFFSGCVNETIMEYHPNATMG